MVFSPSERLSISFLLAQWESVGGLIAYTSHYVLVDRVYLANGTADHIRRQRNIRRRYQILDRYSNLIWAGRSLAAARYALAVIDQEQVRCRKLMAIK